MKSSKFNIVFLFLAIAASLMSACVATVPEQTPVVEPTDQPVSESPAGAAGSLTAQPWQWVAFTSPVEQFDVATPERYRLTFNEDGIVDIVADCNTAIGSYGIDSLDGGSLSIDVAPKTTEVCPPASRGDQFLSLLGGAAIYFFEDGKLYIDLMADGGTMQLDPVRARQPPAQKQPLRRSDGRGRCRHAAGHGRRDLGKPMEMDLLQRHR